MRDVLPTLTALPNLHPAVVHFPIALSVLAAAGAVAALAAPRRWLDRATAALAGLAAVGGWAAWLAGRAAADSVGQLAPAAEATLADHADLALWAALALTAAATGWILAAWRDRTSARPRRGALRFASLALVLLAAGLVARTADLGGALVYRHGVAVAVPTPAPAPAPEPAPSPTPDPGLRLERRDDGTVRWRPAPGDGAALGTLIRVLGPEGRLRSVEGEGPGLTLAVGGAAALCLPGEAAGGVVEALVEPLAFRGRLGPAMGLTGPTKGIAFELGTDGEAALVRLSPGERNVWDTARVNLGGGRLRLALSVAGRHLKGFVDGRMAVHGHGDPGPPGCAGLVLEGTGTVRLLELALRPGSAH